MITSHCDADQEQVGGGDGNDENVVIQQNHRFMDKSAVKRKANHRFFYPNETDKYDLLSFFTKMRPEIGDHLKERCRLLQHLKWYLVVNVELQRESNLGETDTSQPYFHSGTFFMLSEKDDLDHNFNKAFQAMFKDQDGG
ncbi:hypothetical protein FSP39_024593 [Pinctada imbricata]|uniref:Uncharacterized protein n=1 Tax=Pinctada imbricata TaxID=66713 RepID=A0AA89CAE3_PINIB|nr:hypothetical protein FSP39_024593 [Pinctada imbricata]